jgi:hypothetical protein
MVRAECPLCDWEGVDVARHIAQEHDEGDL